MVPVWNNQNTKRSFVLVGFMWENTLFSETYAIKFQAPHVLNGSCERVFFVGSIKKKKGVHIRRGERNVHVLLYVSALPPFTMSFFVDKEKKLSS